MGKLSMASRAFTGHAQETPWTSPTNSLDKSGKSNRKACGEGHCNRMDKAVNKRCDRRRRPVQWTARQGAHEKDRARTPGPLRTPCLFDYFNEVLTEVMTELIPVPMPFTAAMIAIAIPAAISPYSMAVAPDSSFTKRVTNLDIA